MKKQHIAKVELEPAPRLGEKDPNVVQAEAIQAIREAIEAMTHDHRRERPKSVTLPKLQLPTFDGDVLHWQEFWDMFQSSVNTQELPSVTKFTYLKGILRGQAAAAISGIAVTEENYDIALRTLRDKYGRKDVIVESLYASFQKIPIASNEFADVQHTYDAIERILKQLETHEDVNHQRLLIPQILSKFHVDTVTKLEESKKPSEIWTVKSVREALKHYVKIRENVYRRASNTKKMSNQQSRVMERRSSSEALSVAASIRLVDTEKHTTLLPCVFCNDKHYNENCAEYKSLPARKQRLRELGRCFICLQKGHTFTECCNRHLRKCYHCKQSGHHSRALCPRKTNNSKKRFESVAVTTDIQLPKTQDDGDSTCSGASNTTQNLAIGENRFAPNSTVSSCSK